MFRWSGSADDTDRDGALSVDFGTEIPFSTIWCVADATNGEYVITTPGAPVPVSALRPAALRRRGQTVSQFAFDHTLLELLYIEPGRGAWICRDEDGSRTDEDGPNGLTTVSAGRFKPLWTGPEPPSELRPSGVLVAIDPIRLEVTASRLDAALLGAVK
jgi:hypothetical protein